MKVDQNIIQIVNWYIKQHDVSIKGYEHQDLVSEVVLILLKAFPYDEQVGRERGASLGTYIGTICHRCLINVWRKSRQDALAHAWSIQDTVTNLSWLEMETDPLKRILETEEHKLRQEYIRRCCSPFELQVFVQRSRGLMMKEIAQLLGTGVKSVDNALNRIVKKIRADMPSYMS